jgi:hypothetical protein
MLLALLRRYRLVTDLSRPLSAASALRALSLCCVLTEDRPSGGVVMIARAVIGSHLIPVILPSGVFEVFDLGLADPPKDALQRHSCSPPGEPRIAGRHDEPSAGLPHLHGADPASGVTRTGYLLILSLTWLRYLLLRSRRQR